MTALEELLGSDVLTLGMRADEVRRATLGSVVTYLRVHTLTADALVDALSIPEAACELRLYDLPGTIDQAAAHVRAMKAVAGSRRVAAFSMADLEHRAREGWGPIEDVLKRLVSVGLADVAELPVDRVSNLSESMRALTDAGVRPLRLTVSHPLAERKVEFLDRVRDCLQQYSSLIRFAPLPRVAAVDKPTTGYEDVRMVALSRLALTEGREPPVSIEVDWSLYGPKLAQVALTFGADHLDAVLATSDAALGPRRATVEDVERNIRAAGFEPHEVRL